MTDVAFVSRLLLLPVMFVVDPLAPILVFSWALRLGLVHDPMLNRPEFSGFAGDGFLAVATAAYAIHALADKNPFIAHALDGIGLALRPLATALVGFWVVHTLDPKTTIHWVALAVVLLGGVPASFGLQALRAKVRLGASVGTLGVAHPFISTAENVAGLLIATLAVLHPVLALALVIVVGVPVVWLSIKAVNLVGNAAKSAYRHVRGRTQSP